MSTLSQALWITLIGMGLVFIIIIFFWGLMALLVKIMPKDRPEAAEEDEVLAAAVDMNAESETDLTGIKRRAAAAAVAVAIAMQSNASRPLLLPPSSSAGSWQVAMRTRQLSQRTALYSRKPRGNAR